MSLWKRPASDIPDTVTQFLNQKRFLANKSTQASPDGFQASLEFDDARVYFPGQHLVAKVHLPVIDPAEIEGIDVELKGWTHSWGLQSNGQSVYPVYERNVHWTSQNTIAGPTDGKEQTLHITKLDNGSNSWIVKAQLPASIAVKTGWRSHGNTFDIPPTFKDVKRGSMFNSVNWALKLTVKRTANLKRDYRFWRPFLVLPLANPTEAPIPNLPMLAPIAEHGTAIPPTPLSIRSQLLDSQIWNTFEFENKIKTALILSKGVITTHLFVPKTGRAGPIPILLHVAVSAKKAEDLMSSSVRLPDLPLSARAGQDTEPAYPGKGKGKDADSSAHDDFYPSFEIIRRVRSRAQGGANASRHKIPAVVEWDTPAFLSTATDLSKASLDHGYAWTDPMPTAQAGLNVNGNVSESASLPYTRSALLTGRIHINVPPPIDTYNLRVHYRLHFRWNQPGLGNSITTKLGRWVTTTGISAAELQSTFGERLPDDQMSPEQVQAWKDLDRRILGPSHTLLTDPSQNADNDDDDFDAKDSKFDDDVDEEGESKPSKWGGFGRSKKGKDDDDQGPEEGQSHGWRLFSKSKTNQSKGAKEDDDDDSSDDDDEALPEYDAAGRPDGPRDVKQ